jgi:hypothetical protein
MKNKFFAAMLMCLIAVPAMAAVDDAPMASPNQKGSLLYYSDVEIRYAGGVQPISDTIIEMTNDSNDGVYVQLYFINGDDPITEEVRSGTFPFDLLERTHPGWNYVDAQIYLSPNKSTYWSSVQGNNNGADSIQVPPFGNLDADPGPEFVGNGRPDPDTECFASNWAAPGAYRTVRGYVIAWAVDVAGNEVTHNHLAGKALKVEYTLGAAWEYDAWSIRRNSDDAGDGRLELDGAEYGYAPGRLQFDFYTPTEGFDIDLTLHPATADLTAGGAPVTTNVVADIWNQNEDRFSGTQRCITCWDSVLISQYMGCNVLAGNHFLAENIGTDKGKARLDGKDTVCDGAENAAIMGVAAKIFDFGEDGKAMAGSPLTAHGFDLPSFIDWDVIDPGTELRDLEMETINKNREDLNRRAVRSTRSTNKKSTRQ